MRNHFALFVGLRYAGAKRRSQLVSFISGISILGLTLGVGLLLTVLSVMNGFERELRERILGIMPHGTLEHRYGVEDWRALSVQINADDAFLASAPFVSLEAMLSFRRSVQPVALYGIDVAQEKTVSRIDEFIDTRALDDLQTLGGVVIGSGLARKLNVSVGQTLTLLVPSSSGGRELPKLKPLKLLGLIESGTELDHNLALMRLTDASDLSQHPGKVSGLRVKGADLFSVPERIYHKVRELPYGYFGTDWTRSHGNLFHAIQMSKNLVGLLLFLIVAIAAFNVVSTLVMVVVDKQSDIAILKTLGASRLNIMTVFMVQGSVIGALGTGAGLLLGLFGSLGAPALVGFVEMALDMQFLNSDVYPVSYVPVEIWWSDFAVVACISLSMSFAATLFPAWRAAKIEPAEALRYE